MSVWKASRGLGGKSFLLSILACTEAATLAADVNILGGSGEQAKRVIEHMQKLWANPSAPRSLLASEVSRDITFTAGNRVNALMASQASVRGPHPQRLRGDEVDEMDFSLLKAALGQPMSKNGVKSQVVLSSTHHYADGTMTECIKMCAARPATHTYQEWCFKESHANGTGWLTQEMIDTARVNMTVDTWNTEVIGQEPNPESRAFDPTAIKEMFQIRLGEFRDEQQWKNVCEDYDKDGLYCLGADWAKEQDWTVFVVLRVDCKPFRVVYVERAQKEGWKTIIARFDEVATRYHIDGAACHDATGIGNVITDHIRTSAEPVVMRGNPRTELFSDYILAIEHAEIVSPFISYFETAHRTCSRDDLFGNGHPPDEVVAGAMAYKASRWAQPITMP